MSINNKGLTVLLILLSVLLTNNVSSKGYLFWTLSDEGEVWRSELNNLAPEKIIEYSEGRGVALDAENNKVYWMTVGIGGAIRRSNVDGSSRETLIEINETSASGIAMDVAAGKMYWMGDSTLNRANLDGSSAEILISGLTDTRGLALDISAGHVYYRAYDIWKANLNGSNPVAIIARNDNLNFRNMALDTINNKIYYSDSSTDHALRRADFDGMNREVLITGPGINKLQIVDNKLYYSQSTTIIEVDLDGNNGQAYLDNDLGTIGSFVLDISAGNAYFEIYTNNQLVKTDLSGNNPQALMGTTSNPVHDVALDSQSGSLIVSDTNHETIISTDFSGLNGFIAHVEHSDFGKVRGLVYDNTNERIYWVDANTTANGGAIKRMDADGSNFQILVSGINKPHDITLDVPGNKMYWTENIGSGSTLTALIRGANLDGTSAFDVATGLAQGIRGIDFDSANNRLYFTDHTSDNIQRINTDGNLLMSVINASEPHDVAIDNLTGTLYWSEGIDYSGSSTGVIRSSDLDGNNATDLFTGLSDYLRDISVGYNNDEIFENGFE